MTQTQQKLKRVLSFWDIYFIALGQIIGAGVVSLTGVAIGMTGPAVVVAYVFAAILILLSSVLVMVAGATLPAPGAYYAWSSRLLNGWSGSVVVLLLLLASITISLYGSSFGHYLNPLFPAISVNGWGIIVTGALFFGNLFGVQMAAKLQILLVIILLSALAVYAGFAMPKINPELLTPMFPKGLLGFAAAVFLLKFATGGATLVVGLGGETKNPRKTIPLAIVTATLTVAVIYSLVALASVGVTPWEQMVNQPLSVAGKAFLPGWAMTYFLIGGAGVAICTTLNAQFIQLPRNFIVASWDRLIPSWMGSLNRYGSPHWILCAMFAIGVIPLIAGLDIGAIARAATVAATLPALFVYWAITRIPSKYPQQYAQSLLPLSKSWLWGFFIFAMISSVTGSVVLLNGLPIYIICTLLGWFVLAFFYYPLRKYFLAKQGFDLDSACSDRALLEQSCEVQ